MKNISDFENKIKNQNSSEKIRPLIDNDDLFQKIVEDGRYLSKETAEQISKETSEETLAEIKEIIKKEKARTPINDAFFEDMVEHEYITKETADEIKNIIQGDSFLREAYNMNRLFVSTDNRMEGRKSFGSYVDDEKEKIRKSKSYNEEKRVLEEKKLDAEHKKAQEYYFPDNKFDPCLRETFEEMRKYKLSNDLAQAHNIDALNAIVQNESVTNKKFGISIELFPDTPYDREEDATLSRIDCYNASTNLLEVCSRNFLHTYIPDRNKPHSIFAHELAHAVDYTVNKNDFSKMRLKNTVERHFPVIDNDNIDKVRTALTNATQLYHRDFKKYYPTEELIDSSYNVNPEARAAEEFVSFFAQSVSECLSRLKEGEDFGATYEKYIQKQINKISPAKDKLFALDVMSNCSQAYKSKFTDKEVKGLFEVIDEIIEEKREGLKKAEKQLEGSTVAPSTPKVSEKEPNPIPAEDEAKAEKVTQELIEKIQKGEVKAVAIDLTKNFTTWDERVSDAAATKNKALDKNNKILVIDKNNENRIHQVEQKGLHVTIFNPYLNQHLTRTEKENLKHFVPQGELNEKGKYNLNARLAAVNDNQGLLNKLDREAAITTNIDIKAIDAKKSVEAEKTGAVEVA